MSDVFNSLAPLCEKGPMLPTEQASEGCQVEASPTLPSLSLVEQQVTTQTPSSKAMNEEVAANSTIPSSKVVEAPLGSMVIASSFPAALPIEDAEQESPLVTSHTSASLPIENANLGSPMVISLEDYPESIEEDPIVLSYEDQSMEESNQEQVITVSNEDRPHMMEVSVDDIENDVPRDSDYNPLLDQDNFSSDSGNDIDQNEGNQVDEIENNVVAAEQADQDINNYDAQERDTDAHNPLDKKIRKAREKHPMQPPCKCKKKCSDVIDETERKKIWNQFWLLSYDERKTWLYLNVENEAPKRTTSGDNSRRSNTYFYMFKDRAGTAHTVCRTYDYQYFVILC